jgi:hypothetical protein
MAIVTRNTIISDVELRLTRSKISDDFEVTRSQISHWVDTARDEIVRDHLKRAISRKEPIPRYYVELDSPVDKALLTETIGLKDTARYYVTLAFTPLSLQHDAAIVAVMDQTASEIKQINHEQSTWIGALTHSAPTAANPTYYREGNNLFLQGITPGDATTPYVNVYYVKALSGASIADTVELSIEPEFLKPLTDAVEALALDELDRQRFEDTKNDGTQA